MVLPASVLLLFTDIALNKSINVSPEVDGLYEQYGFKPLAKTEIFMEAWNPNVYEDA